MHAKYKIKIFGLGHLGSWTWTGDSLGQGFCFFCRVRTQCTFCWLGVITDPFHRVACCWNFSKAACGKPLIYCYYSHSTWRTISLKIAIYTHEFSASAGRLMAHVADNWGMTRWMSSVNAAWVVGTALPFIFVLPNTSLDDLFHLWNGYLVETARFNSLRGKNTKEHYFNMSFVLWKKSL